MYIREHCFHFVLCVIPSISFHCSCVYVFVVCVQSAAASFVKFYSLQYLANNICTMLHFFVWFGFVSLLALPSPLVLSAGVYHTHTYPHTHPAYAIYNCEYIFVNARARRTSERECKKHTHTFSVDTHAHNT